MYLILKHSCLIYFKTLENLEKKIVNNQNFEAILHNDSNEIFNNERYFVFRDLILKMISAFFKDSKVTKRLQVDKNVINFEININWNRLFLCLEELN
jgi:hypothetical protein